MKGQIPRGRYKSVENFLKDENPERYNVENEYDESREEREEDNNSLDYLEKSVFERYFILKATHVALQSEEKEKKYYPEAHDFILSCKKRYENLMDPDGSGRSKFNGLIHGVYSKLWGWKRNARSYFGQVQLEKGGVFSNEFGADTINSVQTVLNKIVNKMLQETDYTQLVSEKKSNSVTLRYMLSLYAGKKDNRDLFLKMLNKVEVLKEYISIYHSIGNFVLVPARFNGWRGAGGSVPILESDKLVSTSIEDNIGRSLVALKLGSKEINKYLNDKNKKEKATSVKWIFEPDQYIDYINYFFLWDYVDSNGNPIITPEEDYEVFINLACKRIKRRGYFMVMMLRLNSVLGEKTYNDMMQALFIEQKIYKGFDEVFATIRGYLLKEGRYEEVKKLLEDTARKIGSV